MLIRLAQKALRRARAKIGKLWAKAVLRSYGASPGPGFNADGAPLVVCHPKAIIKIGSDVTILNRSESNAAGILHRTILAASQPGARLTIGNRVGLSGAILHAWREITIEDGALLGTGTTIYDTDFHPTSELQRNDQPTLANTGTAPVRICRGAWIGAHATILKGVTVGEYAIVGHSAVVTKDVPPRCIVGGVPARLLGKLG